MKQRFVALAIVIVFFLVSVAFGFFVGRAINKTSISDSSCAEQLNACMQEVASSDEGVRALGISSPIPEAPGFMRYTSTTGVTFVYPAVSDVFEADEPVVAEEFVADGKTQIVLSLGNHDRALYRLPITIHQKTAAESAIDFITKTLQRPVSLFSSNAAMKVKRYAESRRATAPVNTYANDYAGYTGPYFIEFMDKADAVAEISLGSDSIFDSTMDVVNSLEMVKK